MVYGLDYVTAYIVPAKQRENACAAIPTLTCGQVYMGFPCDVIPINVHKLLCMLP